MFTIRTRLLQRKAKAKGKRRQGISLPTEVITDSVKALLRFPHLSQLTRGEERDKRGKGWEKGKREERRGKHPIINSTMHHNCYIMLRCIT